MNILLRILNSLLLAGILVVLILIFLRIREPISVKEPVGVDGLFSRTPISVETRYNRPLEVEISNEPLQVEISR